MGGAGLAVLILAALTGCEPNNPDSVPVGTMEADVDGVHWKAANANANELGESMGYAITVITGATINGDVMNISLVGIQELGTYDFSDDDAPAATASFTDNGDIGETFGADSGTLDITAIDDESAKGTFEFEGTLADGTSTVSVTNGVFNVEWGLFPGF